MGRRILFVTTDQQRYDALGCNGGKVARTPVVDSLAASGIRYERAHPQNVVCMPSRATMLTGQHIRNHGVWMNGVPLPADAPTVAGVLHEAGYRTGLFGKAHFEPFLDPFLRFPENRMGVSGATHDEGRPHRGFEQMEFAGHGAAGLVHYGGWLRDNHPEHMAGYFPVLDMTLEVNPEGGGDTGAPQVKHNPIPRGMYHTDWVADRAISWLDGLDGDDDWFCWLSFPDPHHPWNPPSSELHRVPWRDIDLPAGYQEDPEERERILDSKAPHWRRWYDGNLVSNYEAPSKWVPATLTADQVREVNAMAHIQNELIDEALGKVLSAIDGRGWEDDLDIIYTTDHGEFQGDYGLLFKGPYHVDSLMRLPLIWRPAPSATLIPRVVTEPVGLLDLAPTFCRIAGIEVPDWMDGVPLPGSGADDSGHERAGVITEWDSLHPNGTEVHMQSIFANQMLCTRYEAGTCHSGNEGELYDIVEDPHQQVNLWDDPARAATRTDLLEALDETLPARAEPQLAVEAAV
ncbi:MAG: sulfatase-like hydrolase/transferase [Acidimicrobiia bacterium]|nr:sulfatase-like hydrolase/transferase [Actinomycetota bacterium]MBL6923923.1 sulfatase-like hydrolase/transferase [Acidimicrobiia bacterium]